MQPTVDVFVLGESGPQSAITESAWPASLVLIPTGEKTLPEFASSPWAAELANGETDLVAITAGSDRDMLRNVAVSAMFLGTDREAAANLTFTPIESTRLVLDRIAMAAPCSSVGILLASRAEHGPIVMRRKNLRKIGPLRPVAEPVWDWVIRAARAEQKIDLRTEPDLLRTNETRLPLLVPPARGTESDWLREHLTKVSIDELSGGPSRLSNVEQTAHRAGLYQWHDFLKESHELSQTIEGEGENQLGDYWHAIMHRREPDYSNAKYWFRQIGNQPTYRELRQEADAILDRSTDPAASRWRARLQSGSKWDPFAFVDLCEECADHETTELAMAARRIQYVEMSMLV